MIDIEQITKEVNETVFKDYPLIKQAVYEWQVEYILKAIRKLGYAIIVKDGLAEAEWYQQFEEKV